jgi:hypothetical protein
MRHLLLSVLLVLLGSAVNPALPEEAPGGNKPASAPLDLKSRTLEFKAHNMKWTLPEGTPFKWEEPEVLKAVDEQGKEVKTNDVALVRARATLPREKPEDGEPRQNVGLITLVVRPLEAGHTAAMVAANKGVHDSISKQVFEGKPDEAKTKVDSDRKIGNYHGASLTMAAGRGKVIHYFLFIVVTLKETEYRFQTKLEGGKDVTASFGKELSAMLNGVEFLDTTELVRGPLEAAPVPAHGSARGDDLDKEVEKAVPGLQLKKPKGLAALKPEGDSTLRFAWEARSADGKAYFYFDARSYDVADMAKAKKSPEDLIREREGQWKGAGGDKAVTVTKGKDAHFDTNWAGEKGLGYRFTGDSGGYPFVELGWIVKVKSYHYWFRVQFGGEGAEKSMDGLFKAAKKGVKFP